MGEQRGRADLRRERGAVQGRLACKVPVNRQCCGMQGDGDAVAAEGWYDGELVA
jgi:hypothetical protein